MNNREIIAGLKKWQGMAAERRQRYLGSFAKHMVYSTTKCEHPEVTLNMVRKILK